MSEKPTLVKLYYRAKEIAQISGIARTTLYGYIKKGLFPKPIKFGSMSLWRKEDVDSFFTRLEMGGKSNEDLQKR